jgi:hypothetical protein
VIAPNLYDHPGHLTTIASLQPALNRWDKSKRSIEDQVSANSRPLPTSACFQQQRPSVAATRGTCLPTQSSYWSNDTPQCSDKKRMRLSEPASEIESIYKCELSASGMKSEWVTDYSNPSRIPQPYHHPSSVHGRDDFSGSQYKPNYDILIVAPLSQHR